MNAQVMAYKKQYAEQSVNMASPHKLVDLLLDELLIKLSVLSGFSSSSLPEKIAHEACQKALLIIEELQGGIDLDKGGEIAENLDAIYYFSHKTLKQKQSIPELSKNAALLLEIIRPISLAWKSIGNT